MPKKIPTQFFAIFSLCALGISLAACQQKTADKAELQQQRQANTHKSLAISNLRVINAAISTALVGAGSRPSLFGGTNGTIIYKMDNQWHAANTAGIAETIMGFCANGDDNRILAVGSNGLLAMSADDGKNWKNLSLASSTESFFSCHYDKTHQRWLVGSDGGPLLYSKHLDLPWLRADNQAPITHVHASRGDKFLLGTGPEFLGHSEDGGKTWRKILSVKGAVITALLDLKTHLIVTTDQGALWRTTDLIHWDEIAIQPDSAILGIAEDQANKTLSLITSRGDIFISDDQGANWGVSFHAESPLAQLSYSETRQQLIAVGNGGIFYSDNGGRVWQKSSAGFSDEIIFVWNTPEELVAFGPGGFMANSMDGKQWKTQRPAIAHFIHQIKPTLDNSLLLAGASGLLMRSADGGESWQQPQAGITEQDFLFSLLITPSAQFAAGPPGTILRSTDGGQSWQAVLSIKNAEKGYFHEIIGNGGDKLVAIASPGNSYFSVDNGQSWQPISIDNSQHLFSGVYAPKHKQFIIVGNGGSIFGSSDGHHWIKLPSNTTANLQGITAIGSHLFASGSEGTILRSADGGQSWQQLNTNTRIAIQHIFPAGENLLATGLHGLMLRSEDKGDNWQTISLPETEHLREPAIDQATGIIYVSGRSGTILFSRDAGKTWDKLPQVTLESIKGIYIDDTRRMLIGYGARLVRIPLLER